jgi:hypothetical protein
MKPIISTSLARAIEEIFGDRNGGSFLELPEDLDATPEDINQRINQLRTVLEGYVINMAAELSELGDVDRPRLEAEARATLIALRELYRFFPNLRDDDQRIESAHCGAAGEPSALPASLAATTLGSSSSRVRRDEVAHA